MPFMLESSFRFELVSERCPAFSRSISCTWWSSLGTCSAAGTPYIYLFIASVIMRDQAVKVLALGSDLLLKLDKDELGKVLSALCEELKDLDSLFDCSDLSELQKRTKALNDGGMQLRGRTGYHAILNSIPGEQHDRDMAEPCSSERSQATHTGFRFLAGRHTNLHQVYEGLSGVPGTTGNKSAVLITPAYPRREYQPEYVNGLGRQREARAGSAVGSSVQSCTPLSSKDNSDRQWASPDTSTADIRRVSRANGPTMERSQMLGVRMGRARFLAGGKTSRGRRRTVDSILSDMGLRALHQSETRGPSTSVVGLPENTPRPTAIVPDLPQTSATSHPSPFEQERPVAVQKHDLVGSVGGGSNYIASATRNPTRHSDVVEEASSKPSESEWVTDSANRSRRSSRSSTFPTREQAESGPTNKRAGGEVTKDLSKRHKNLHGKSPDIPKASGKPWCASINVPKTPYYDE